jgi:hypothetical protein
MKLIMRNSETAPPQDLPAHENYVETGLMSDCVSVVVLWNPNAAGVYQNVRGYHGGGGLGHVNWNSLFAGVWDAPNTYVVMISGSNHLAVECSKSNKEQMRAAVANADLQNIRIKFCHGFVNARVDRRCEIQGANGLFH